MKLLGILIVASCIGACSALKPGCIVQNQAASLVSKVVVTQLQCGNASAVEADILAGIAKLGLCAPGIQGPVADAICPAVTQYAVSFLADKAIPAAWQCSSLNAQAALSAAVAKACSQLPLAPKK